MEHTDLVECYGEKSCGIEEHDMNNLTILMVLYNEADYAKLSLQSIRLFADIENLSVVMIDNHSNDGVADWAKMQEDITYVCMDEEKLPFGQALNEVCEALQIEGDLMIMDAHYMLTPHALSRLQTVLYQDDAVGAVGGMSNAISLFQKAWDIENYEKAVSQGNQECVVKQGKWVLGLHPDVIYMKASAISQTGKFDEELISQEYVMKDFCFRMLMSDWKLQVCEEALVWDIRGNGPYYSVDPFEKTKMEKKVGNALFQFRL